MHGPNGAGKSNLLEALYFGCTGRSPSTRNERELDPLRRAGHPRPVVRGAQDGQEHELSVAYGTAPEGERAVKRMSCDGAHVERLLDVPVQALCISVFLPERLELLKGPPALRRAHLDQVSRRIVAESLAGRGVSTRACWLSATRCSLASARAAAPPRRLRPGTASWRSRRWS